VFHPKLVIDRDNHVDNKTEEPNTTKKKPQKYFSFSNFFSLLEQNSNKTKRQRIAYEMYDTIESLAMLIK